MSNGNPTCTLVVNPTAGRGRAGRLLPQVMAELLRGLPEGTLEVRRADSFEQARDYCHQAVAQAPPSDPSHHALVVMGGDGMMHLGLNAVAQSGLPLGLIPAGTGNDFCRGVGLPLDPLKAARIVVEGVTRQLDLASVTGQMAHGGGHSWVGSVVSTGYDAFVSRRGNAMPRAWGSMAYAVAALAELRRFKPLPYRLVIDGEARSQTAMFVSVANATYFGGGMNIAPDGSPSDGLLDVTVIHPVSRLTLLRLLPSMFTGAFVKDPAVERLKAKEVMIDGDGLYGMADGEVLGPVPLHVQIVPEALTVYAPPSRSLSRRRKAS
ncbi:MAG: diacylglycerol kinase family lipid kinase [Propionibacteriaceae bacterium]|jgi:diacylglycerol kinase (ATP)|nr:diacylglycerol kinase family lipid kinase [Propionibacteriaceae bacterium]